MVAALAWLCAALLAVVAADANSAQSDSKAPVAVKGVAPPPGPIKQVLRPGNELPSTRFAAELAAANAEAIDLSNRLRALRAKSPPPPNCERRLLRAGTKRSGFRVRPGQHLVIEGCLRGALPGMVRLNGTFPGGHVVLHVDEWTDTYVRARLPDVTGMFDTPARVQVRFGDGTFSNELPGDFIARRATYELAPHQFAQFLAAKETSATKVCGWNADCAPDTPAQDWLPPHGGLLAQASTPRAGTLAIRGHHPQHHVVGYFGQNRFGASQFSHWGPAGELMLDWTTGNFNSDIPLYVFALFLTKFVVDAPVGTLPGARPFGAPPFNL